MTSRLISGLAALALVAAAMPAPAMAAAPQDRGASCRYDDMPCRIDRLERQLDRVIELLEDQGDRPRRGGGDRGQEMTVNQQCSFSSCPDLAVTLCRNAGFQRGVPTEISNSGIWPTLVRARCSD